MLALMETQKARNEALKLLLSERKDREATRVVGAARPTMHLRNRYVHSHTDLRKELHSITG